MSTLKDAIRLLREGDWQAAHPIVQEDESSAGCWAHGIVHLLEGDRENARYWYRRAGRTLPRKDLAGAIGLELDALEIASTEQQVPGATARP